MARQGQSPAQAGSLGWPAEDLSADHSRGTFGRRVRSHPEQTQAEDRVDKERGILVLDLVDETVGDSIPKVYTKLVGQKVREIPAPVLTQDPSEII
jgi:hypothetical protein